MEFKDSFGCTKSKQRPTRNKRYNTKVYGDGNKPVKRLFTPEIKRFLKDWLLRRRDNPYPNREEKKTLAIQTGLTYIQVCNWFANWRRKLKNAGKEPQQKTWGYLIKSYNSQVQGNVEHISICSDDSIWQEFNSGSNNRQTSSSSKNDNERYSEEVCDNPFSQHNNNNFIEKYSELNVIDESSKPSMITKWLESAVNFKPSHENYLWAYQENNQFEKRKRKKSDDLSIINKIRNKQELDAAEALTSLANVY